jgi:hypothetical protein
MKLVRACKVDWLG